MARTCITGAEASRIRGKAEDTLTASARTGIGDRVKDLSAPATRSPTPSSSTAVPFTPSPVSPRVAHRSIVKEQAGLRQGLDKADVKSIANYTAFDRFDNVNQFLRGNVAKIQVRDRKTIEALDRAMRGAVIPDEVLLFRGGRIPADAVVGTVIQDSAFVSTSTSRRAVSEFVKGSRKRGPRDLIKIRAGRQSRGLAINKELNPIIGAKNGITLSDELEVILPRGSRFIIVDIAEGKEFRTVTMELLP